MRVLHELHTTMKTYQSYQSEAKQAEAKLKVAENQRLKIEQAVPKEKLEKSKKVRLIGKEVQKVIEPILHIFLSFITRLAYVFLIFCRLYVYTYIIYMYFRERTNISMQN